ncbi:hypothetical protein [Jiangella alba]|uniref:Adenylylsulfate kinase n=1 Tax=Jiangella alba TaxID=561176 RepID=A0A1H5DUR0_9ACTN|nr:hypothetical protein [Jiangella alba]SED82621.1 hypothetical protein SAMN04488561_0527 [Jiangella alba]
MTAPATPLLWLCGASGVGKSTVGWEIFRQLSEAGVRSAYVDLDQLGLCYPAPDDDPGNHRVKAASLGRTWPAYRDGGASCLIASGIAESRQVVRAYAAQVPGAALTVVRLRVSAAGLRERIVRRGWMVELADRAVAEAAELDRADVTGLRVDTDDRSVAEVAALVRAAAGGWPVPA